MTTLNGLKVLVTRPTHQAGTLCQLIEQAGGIPIPFPLLSIRAISDETQLAQQLKDLSTYDWLIFISPNAVNFGLNAINKFGTLPPQINIAAVGSGTQKTLNAANITNIISPATQFDSAGLLALNEFQHITGQKILIFRGETGREELADTLKQRGAIVEYASCYIREAPTLSIQQLLLQQPDVITITSSEAVGHLSELIQPHPNCFGTPIFCPHPRIAACAQQQGWRHVITTESGDQNLLNAIIDWFIPNR